LSDEMGQGNEQQPTEMSEEGAGLSPEGQGQPGETAMSTAGSQGQASEGSAASEGDQMSEPVTVAVVAEDVIEIGEAAPSEMSSSESAPSAVDEELVSRLEGELARARDVVVAAERAASAVGLSTATTGGRIECEYDLQTETLVARSVSFELEF